MIRREVKKKKKKGGWVEICGEFMSEKKWPLNQTKERSA